VWRQRSPVICASACRPPARSVVGDEGVEPPSPSAKAWNIRFDRRRVGMIAAGDDRLSPERADRRRHLFGVGLPAVVGDAHIRAGPREQQRRRPADATRSPGDHHGLPLQRDHRMPPSSIMPTMACSTARCTSWIRLVLVGPDDHGQVHHRPEPAPVPAQMGHHADTATAGDGSRGQQVRALPAGAVQDQQVAAPAEGLDLPGEHLLEPEVVARGRQQGGIRGQGDGGESPPGRRYRTTYFRGDVLGGGRRCRRSPRRRGCRRRRESPGTAPPAARWPRPGRRSLRPGAPAGSALTDPRSRPSFLGGQEGAEPLEERLLPRERRHRLEAAIGEDATGSGAGADRPVPPRQFTEVDVTVRSRSGCHRGCRRRGCPPTPRPGAPAPAPPGPLGERVLAST